MTGHVAPPAEWALPEKFEATERVLRAYDGALRLRRSIDYAGYYVLERLTAQTKPVDTTADGLTDLKLTTRDGYLQIATVHPYFVEHPDEMLEQLLANGNDLQRLGTGYIGSGAARYVDEMRTEQDDARANRRRHRRQEWEGFYAEGYDTLNRLGDSNSHAERTRINNAGGAEPLKVTDRRRVKLEDLEPTTSAGVTPAQESSDVYPPESSGRRDDGQLHGQSSA